MKGEYAMKSWKQRKISTIRSLFGGNIDQYRKDMETAEIRNDKQLYIVIYEKVLEALETMKDINRHFTGRDFA